MPFPNDGKATVKGSDKQNLHRLRYSPKVRTTLVELSTSFLHFYFPMRRPLPSWSPYSVCDWPRRRGKKLVVPCVCSGESQKHPSGSLRDCQPSSSVDGEEQERQLNWRSTSGFCWVLVLCFPKCPSLKTTRIYKM